MKAQRDTETEFTQFARQISGFERTLYGLVASSFVFSLIGAATRSYQFADSIGFAAMTTLVGTIGGVAGVLVTYLGWSGHPMDAFAARIGFRAADFAFGVLLNFVVSIFSIYAFYAVGGIYHMAALAALPFGTFFFFRGMTTGFLVAQEKEAQSQSWEALSPEKKTWWVNHLEEVRRFVQEVNKRSAQTRRETKEVIDNTYKMKREAFLIPYRVRLEFFHYRTMKLRVSIAGEWLLLPSERLKYSIKEMELKKALQKLEVEIAQEAHAKIKDRALQPLKVEGESIEIYNENNWYYTFIREPLDDASAVELLHALTPVRTTPSEFSPQIVAFVEGQGGLTIQARDRLKRGFPGGNCGWLRVI